LEITYLGHSAFRLRGKEVTVVTDPFPPDIGLDMGKVDANIVTVSHASPNHCFISGVAGGPRVVDGPGEYEIAEVLIAGVATESSPVKGPVNTAYVIRLDDLAICHLGDLSTRLSDSQVEGIGDIDVLMIPVGGAGALAPAAAAEVVAQLEPSVVIPMHYNLGQSSADNLAPVDNFVREMGSKEFTPEAKLSVTRSSLPSEVKVAVLQAKNAVGV
jgi:L-ascorbate metabolism protein UlaG (beta-lactamase superfamily)